MIMTDEQHKQWCKDIAENKELKAFVLSITNLNSADEDECSQCYGYLQSDAKKLLQALNDKTG